MRIRKDLALALATIEGLMLVLLVTMPTWLLAVIITLTVVAAALTVTTIMSAWKASYDEEAETHTYRFPIWQFVIGAVFLAALTVAIFLASKRLFGFALIPVAAILAALLVIATLKKLKIMQFITAVLLAILVLFLVSYGTAYMVKAGVNLNPGMQTSAPVGGETQNPNDETQTPNDETQTPNDQKPSDDNQDNTGDNTTNGTPVTVKIDAPDTLSYGKPITVKLEGCKVDDLVFGNEDFIAISKVSDTEVSIILVGIVNETTGKVEIVPASGYITITDSVSGTNVTINIVE